MTKATEKASELAGKAKAGKAALSGDTGIFKRLQEEHTGVSTLMKRVSISNDPEVRHELFTKIRKELLAHAEGEEREFYSVLREYEATRDLATHGHAEHEELESILRELGQLDVASDRWLEKFHDLQRMVEHHIQDEEHQLFPKAQEVIEHDRAKKMEHRYAEAKQEARAQV